jgi:hypothetical protein
MIGIRAIRQGQKKTISIAIDADDRHPKFKASLKKEQKSCKLMRASGIPATATMPIHIVRRKPDEVFGSWTATGHTSSWTKEIH